MYNEFMIITVAVIAILLMLAFAVTIKEPTKEEIRKVNDKHSKDTF